MAGARSFPWVSLSLQSFPWVSLAAAAATANQPVAGPTFASPLLPCQVADIEKAEKDKMRQKCEAIIGHGINCFINRQASPASIELPDSTRLEYRALPSGRLAVPAPTPSLSRLSFLSAAALFPTLSRPASPLSPLSCLQLIYNFPEELFADAGVMAIEHADFDGIERLALVLGEVDGHSTHTTHTWPAASLHGCLEPRPAAHTRRPHARTQSHTTAPAPVACRWRDHVHV